MTSRDLELRPEVFSARFRFVGLPSQVRLGSKNEKRFPAVLDWRGVEDNTSVKVDFHCCVNFTCVRA